MLMDVGQRMPAYTISSPMVFKLLEVLPYEVYMSGPYKDMYNGDGRHINCIIHICIKVILFGKTFVKSYQIVKFAHTIVSYF